MPDSYVKVGYFFEGEGNGAGWKGFSGFIMDFCSNELSSSPLCEMLGFRGFEMGDSSNYAVSRSKFFGLDNISQMS